MSFISRPRIAAALALAAAAASVQAANVEVLDTRFVSAMTKGETELANAAFDAFTPALAANPQDGRVFFVWAGDSAAFPAESGEGEERHFLVDDEFEVFGAIYDAGVFAVSANQFRISAMGDDAETDAETRQRFDAANPAVAWNPVAQEFLVVWEGDTDEAPLVDDEFEIFGQRVSTDGTLLGTMFRISTMGNDDETVAEERRRYGAFKPAVAVNTETGDYLVVWQGDDDQAAAMSGNTTVDDEFEIFGRIVSAAGEPSGPQFRISAMGADTEPQPDQRALFDASDPAVVFNAASGEFVVAWSGDDNTGTTVEGESEIFAQRLDENGAPLGGMIRVSAMGPDGDPAYDAFAPALAVNPDSGDVLFAWHGDTDAAPLVEGEYEVYARLLDATGNFPGNAFRVSVMGSDDDTDGGQRARFAATDATVAWEPYQQQYLVAWRGDEDENPRVNDEFEIFARIVAPDGSLPYGRVKLSTQGTDGEEDPAERVKYEARTPAVVGASGAFFVAWSGDSDLFGYTNGDFEITGIRAATSATELLLEVRVADTQERYDAPEPVRVPLDLTNEGEHVAENVVLRFDPEYDWPMSLEGCESTPAENECALGDLLPGDTVGMTLVLQTSHLTLDDDLGNLVTVYVDTPTAVIANYATPFQLFLAVSLTVDGGSGGTGLGLLAALALLARWSRSMRLRKSA